MIKKPTSKEELFVEEFPRFLLNEGVVLNVSEVRALRQMG